MQSCIEKSEKPQGVATYVMVKNWALPLLCFWLFFRSHGFYRCCVFSKISFFSKSEVHFQTLDGLRF